jgi:hypothetical protein
MGVSETEIVFQTEYSKQNLKKLVESYPSSLVKKVCKVEKIAHPPD